MQIRFQTPYQYFFVHRDVKHLLLLWKKERKRQVYIVEEENDSILLRFPGETYEEIVLQEIEPIFFQRLETNEGPFAAILGATFSYQDRLMAMYYHQERLVEELYFFEVKEDTIIEISEEEYQNVVQTFVSNFPEYISQQ